MISNDVITIPGSLFATNDDSTISSTTHDWSFFHQHHHQHDFDDFTVVPSTEQSTHDPRASQDNFHALQDSVRSLMLDYSLEQCAARPDYYFAGANGAWPTQDYDNSTASLSPAHYSPYLLKSRQHQRALSTSTAASQQSASSPAQPAPLYAHGLLDPTRSRPAQTFYYPTPSQTPVQDPPMDRTHARRNLPPHTSVPTQSAHTQARQLAQPQPQSQQQQQQQQQQHLRPRAQMPHIAQYPQYSSQDYPATPNTAVGGDYSDRQYDTHAMPGHAIPRLEHSMTQACGDELYNPSVIIPPPQYPQNMHMNQGLLQPNGVQRRIEEAQQARSKSPIDLTKRDASPYLPGAPEDPIRSARDQRLSQKREDDRYQQWRHQTRGVQDINQQPNTISPKDAYMDNFHAPSEDSASLAPLFPEGSSSSQQLFDDGNGFRGYDMNNGARFLSGSFTFQSVPQLPTSANGAVSTSSSSDHKLPALQNHSSTSSDTPAHLISMDTSKSEPDSSSQEQSLPPPKPQHRPAAHHPTSGQSTPDVGTYSCTYNGCPRRFASAAALQTHKRTDHRSNAHSGPTTRGSDVNSPRPTDSRSVSPSGQDERAMQSQAGPHRCDRINPSTGKSCNTVFSRPYDLTRHEDTIHARRPKVSCTYCAERGEEKTFSRADALTRHLRVVHPDVEVYGKGGRRRGL